MTDTLRFTRCMSCANREAGDLCFACRHNRAEAIFAQRARVILENMAKERKGWFGRRWSIHHEPLRADAQRLLGRD